MNVWRSRKSSYTPELARTTFLKAKILGELGKEAEAKEEFINSMKWRNSIPNADEILDIEKLWEEDFDVLVTYFSR